MKHPNSMQYKLNYKEISFFFKFNNITNTLLLIPLYLYVKQMDCDKFQTFCLCIYDVITYSIDREGML